MKRKSRIRRRSNWSLWSLFILFSTALIALRCSHAPTGSDTPPPARLTLHMDTVAVAVRDLSKSVPQYRDALGFNIQGSAPDKNIQAADAVFTDGSRLRLISTKDEGSADELRSFLEEREGVFHIALRPNHIVALRRQIEAAGERLEDDPRAASIWGKGIRAQRLNRLSPLSFLSFIEPSSNPAVASNAHRNTAIGLSEAWIVVDSLSEIEDEVRRLGLGETHETILQPMRARALAFRLDGSELIFVQRDHLEPEALTHLGGLSPQITGVSLDIRNIESTGAFFKRGGRVKHAIARYNEKSCLILAPKYTNGLFLELIKAR